MVRESWRNRIKSEQRWVNGPGDGEREILQGDISSSFQFGIGRAGVSILSAPQEGLFQYVLQTPLPHLQLQAFHAFLAEEPEADLSGWHPGVRPPAWYEADIARRVELHFRSGNNGDFKLAPLANKLGCVGSDWWRERFEVCSRMSSKYIEIVLELELELVFFCTVCICIWYFIHVFSVKFLLNMRN